MIIYIMTEAEQQLAQIIWENEPLGSGELVKLASEQLNWKKSTTYTADSKPCEYLRKQRGFPVGCIAGIVGQKRILLQIRSGVR